jgi:hypothetical protein
VCLAVFQEGTSNTNRTVINLGHIIANGGFHFRKMTGSVTATESIITEYIRPTEFLLWKIKPTKFIISFTLSDFQFIIGEELFWPEVIAVMCYWLC